MSKANAPLTAPTATPTTTGSTSLIGRVLLSLILVTGIGTEIGFVWFGLTGDHIFNPAWHPHGRFHAAQFMSFVILLALMGLWLTWRPSLEPRVSLRIVLAVIVFLSVSQFVAAAVPGTSPSPVLSDPNTFPLFGLRVHGNLFFSVLMIILGLLGYWLASRPYPRLQGSGGYT